MVNASLFALFMMLAGFAVFAAVKDEQRRDQLYAAVNQQVDAIQKKVDATLVTQEELVRRFAR